MTVDAAKKDFQRALHYLPDAEKKNVLRALVTAEKLHDGQSRTSGEPYIHHPIAVASYLAELEASQDVLIAALLHDAVEDEHTTFGDVSSQYGETIAKLVDGVTKLSKRRYEGRMAERQVASLRKMLLTAHEDLRVILIKLADRKHNIETIGALPQQKQERVAAETLDIYVPFARLVGLWELKERFETVCFPIVYPEESAKWHAIIEQKRSEVLQERLAFIQQINEKTTNNVHASMQQMTDYEIYTKMQGNIHLLDKVYNIDSAHLVVQSDSFLDCYHLLGEVHAQYPVHVGSFRDYISSPQANGYRALHTTIFLSQNHELRLRIQTQSMHEHASNRKIPSWLNEEQANIYDALSGLHAAPLAGHEKYLQDLKASVLSRPIHVFTTSGDIFSLPKDATGVDFAFALNPGHMSYLAGIRINGELVEASHALQDGDTVDLVLLAEGESEQRTMWMEQVKSVEARERIRRSLRRSPKQQRRMQGRKLLEQEAQKWRMSLWPLEHIRPLQRQFAQALECTSYEEALEQIGTGTLPVRTAVEVYQDLVRKPRGIYVTLLKFLGLLPKTRILDKEAQVIDIEVYAADRPGLIYGISKCFAERHINIANFFVYAVPPEGALYKIRLEVKNFEEFSALYDALLQVPDVDKVVRVR
ncbi:MAG: HD domain-containing protein [Candidatus Peribacteraceae bacterium]|nr:HD domain-containing protein [Candidatus Peribacteraceae bacterium]